MSGPKGSGIFFAAADLFNRKPQASAFGRGRSLLRALACGLRLNDAILPPQKRLPTPFRWLMAMALLLVRSSLARPAEVQAQDKPNPVPSRVVIPFDFESKFDDGRYGRMIGDMLWKKLDRTGGFVLPESMLDVRDWSERRRATPGHGTPLSTMKEYVRQDFQAHIGIWGSVERVAGTALDEYDLWIHVADFSGEEPRVIYDKQARTKTVSEIPHAYIHEALDKLVDRQPRAIAAADPELERRWQTGPNLIAGDFEKGTDHPTGWDALPRYARRATVNSDDQRSTQVVRFQFPEDIAGTTGVLYYSDFFPVEEGATYRFQCRWRTTGSAAKVFIKCYDRVPTEFQGAQQPDTSQRREVYRSQQNLLGPAKIWNIHTEDFTPRHTQFSPKWGRVMLYAYWPAGAVDWDDVVVKQVKPK